MDKIYIYGASGHGLAVADVARSCGYKSVVFVDDSGELKFEDITNDAPIIIAIGDNAIRAKLQIKAQESGFEITSLIHPSAIISPSSTIGKGVVVMPNVVVNAKAKIGEGVILNTACVVEHECVIGDFVHLSPNVALAGGVKVGDFTHIGIGSCVIQKITIGSSTLVGAGSVVVSDIGKGVKAFGNPCKVRN